MILYIYGPDSYRRTKALREKIIAPYLIKYPDGLIERFHLSEEGELERLKEFSLSQSLFAKVKLGIIYDPSEGEKSFISLLKEVLEDKTITLVVVAEKKLTKEFNFLLDKPVTSYSFEPITGAQFITFLKKEAAEQDLKVSDTAIKELGELYDGDSWSSITEMRKIAAGGLIEKKSKIPDFFPLLQGLKGSTPNGRLKSLFYILETTEPAAVFNVLGAMVSGSDKVKMADYDIAIKTGKLEYEEALLDFVLR